MHWPCRQVGGEGRGEGGGNRCGRMQVHCGYRCDICEAFPIVGKRFTCYNCGDYDLWVNGCVCACLSSVCVMCVSCHARADARGARDAGCTQSMPSTWSWCRVRVEHSRMHLFVCLCASSRSGVVVLCACARVILLRDYHTLRCVCTDNRDGVIIQACYFFQLACGDSDLVDAIGTVDFIAALVATLAGTQTGMCVCVSECV